VRASVGKGGSRTPPTKSYLIILLNVRGPAVSRDVRLDDRQIEDGHAIPRTSTPASPTASCRGLWASWLHLYLRPLQRNGPAWLSQASEDQCKETATVWTRPPPHQQRRIQGTHANRKK
jgi:hypothetical protein